MSGNRSEMTYGEQSRIIEEFGDVSQVDALDDFLRLLRGEEGVETVSTDHLKSQAQVVSITLPTVRP